jgi:hypothetical protein
MNGKENIEPIGEVDRTVYLSYQEYLDNLTDEGFDELYCDEELSDYKSEEEDNQGENQGEQEELFQSRGEELVTDLSTMWNDERRCFEERFSERRFECVGCNCRSGETCGWRASPTYDYLLGVQVENEKSELLGLCYRETWELQSSEFTEEGIRIRDKRRSESSDTWYYPEGLLDITDIKIRGCCKNAAIWLYCPIGDHRNARLLVSELNQDDRFQILYYECINFGVEKQTKPATKVQWNGRSYRNYSRMVEYQFVRNKKIQSETTMDIWTSEFSEDYSSNEAKRIYSHLPIASRRGFLRLI